MQNKSNISIVLGVLLLNTSVGFSSSLSQSLSQRLNEYLKKYPAGRLLTHEELDEKLHRMKKEHATLISERRQKQLNRILQQTDPRKSVKVDHKTDNKVKLLSRPRQDQLTQLIQACLQPVTTSFNENEKYEITEKLKDVSVQKLTQGCSDFYAVNKIDVQSSEFIKAALQAFINVVAIENLEKVVSDSHLFPLLDQKFKDWIQLLNHQIQTGSISDEGGLKNFMMKWSSILLSNKRILKANYLNQNIPVNPSVLSDNLNINVASSNIIQNNNLLQTKNTIERRANDIPHQTIDPMIETPAVRSEIVQNPTGKIETNVASVAAPVIATLSTGVSLKDDKANIAMKHNDINKIAVFRPGERMFHADLRDQERSYEREKRSNPIVGGTASLNGGIQQTEPSHEGVQQSAPAQHNTIEYQATKSESDGLIRDRNVEQMNASKDLQTNSTERRDAHIERDAQITENDSIVNEARTVTQSEDGIAKTNVKKGANKKVVKSNKAPTHKIVKGNRKKAPNKKILNTVDNINNLDEEIVKKKKSPVQDDVNEGILKDNDLQSRYQMDQSVSETDAVEEFQEN